MPLFDKKDKSRYATFTRRSVGMGGGMAAIFAVLGGRLYQLQIRDGDQYLIDAEANRISERLIAPPRGRIIDRFGVELAGALEVAMRPNQVLTLLAANDWAAMADWIKAMNGDPSLAEWRRYREASITRSDEHLLLPVRHDPTGPRQKD